MCLGPDALAVRGHGWLRGDPVDGGGGLAFGTPGGRDRISAGERRGPRAGDGGARGVGTPLRSPMGSRPPRRGVAGAAETESIPARRIAAPGWSAPLLSGAGIGVRIADHAPPFGQRLGRGGELSRAGGRPRGFAQSADSWGKKNRRGGTGETSWSSTS